MWSYSFEIPILMILTIILGFFFSRPRLPIKRNLTFVHMILIETATILIDVSASAVDNNYASYSPAFVNFLNMLYFIAFFLRAYIMYVFSASVLKDSLHKNTLIRQVIRIPLFIGIILSLLSAFFGSADFPHFIFYIDEAGYHSGTVYNLLYVCGFCYVFLALLSLFLFRKNLGRRREKYGILLYNMIIFTALVIRLTLPRYLIMDTFVLMAILVVFLAFGNPEYYLDLRGTAFNRLALSEHLEENRKKLKYQPFGVVIHNYHEMRDIYGSTQIEEGLVLISRFLKRLMPKGIIFYCRKGRFIVLDRPGSDFEGKAREIAERFRHSWKSQTVELYLSAGFATFEMLKGTYSSEILLTTLLKSLETAGRGELDEPVRITEEDVKQSEIEKKVRESIETALESTGYELYLQPIVDVKTGEVIGAEALSRIRDAEGKIIPPGIFIPVAETSGRINGLGELAFDRTCRFIKENGLEKLGLKWINVNLSPLQFLCTDLAERYTAIVEKYDIDPQTVHLEITEEAMIDDSFLNKQIKTMGGKGFIFVLDDYGTGYSNLSRLKKCPFSNVKLDMSIVWDYCREPDEILPNMIQALKNMGFSITAEGVENEDMVNTMKKIGCDFLQGYYYSKPLPANEFAKSILQDKRT